MLLTVIFFLLIPFKTFSLIYISSYVVVYLYFKLAGKFITFLQSNFRFIFSFIVLKSIRKRHKENCRFFPQFTMVSPWWDLAVASLLCIKSKQLYCILLRYVGTIYYFLIELILNACCVASVKSSTMESILWQKSVAKNKIGWNRMTLLLLFSCDALAKYSYPVSEANQTKKKKWQILRERARNEKER